MSHAPVWSYAELFSHPQTADRGLRVSVCDPDGNPVDLLGSPFHPGGVPVPPSRLGQDTDAVLRDLLGLDAERLVALRAQGVI